MFLPYMSMTSQAGLMRRPARVSWTTAAIIRAHCLDCCDGSSDEVRKCTALGLPQLAVPHRDQPMARAPLSEAERTRRRDRIARGREEGGQFAGARETTGGGLSIAFRTYLCPCSGGE